MKLCMSDIVKHELASGSLDWFIVVCDEPEYGEDQIGRYGSKADDPPSSGYKNPLYIIRFKGWRK